MRLDNTSFNQTQTASAYNSGQWQKYLTLIRNFLGVQYSKLTYNNGAMLVPLYNSLAARFYLEHVKETSGAAIPFTLSLQADYFVNRYNHGRGSPNATAFMNMVNNIPAVCNAAGADILFILDASGSIGAPNFNTMLKFVSGVVGQASFPIGNNSYKFAVDRFSSTVTSEIFWNGYNNNVTELQQQIGRIRYTGGSTRTDLALYHALYVTFNTSSGQGARDPSKGYPQIAVILTDGQPDPPAQRTNIAAEVVKQNGITLFTVGLGNAFTDPTAAQELKTIASYPKCMRTYLLTQYNILQAFTAELKTQTCQANAVVVPKQGSIKNAVKPNQYFYFKFSANSTAGISFQVSMNTGSTTLYLSLSVRNPSEVEYDFAINSSVGNNGSIYIPPNVLTNITNEFLLSEEVILAQIGASGNATNATIPVFGSLKGTGPINNNFTLSISQGNTVPNTTTSTSTTRMMTTRMRTTQKRRTTTKAPPGVGYKLQVLLEYFDNTAGGGMLFSSRTHCDPFWFTGLDMCDLALKICVEPAQAPQSMTSCQTGWIDLGQVTSNNNNATFPTGKRIGGWTNPMNFNWKVSWTGFQVKYMVTDVDRGARQTVCSNICRYTNAQSSQGTIGCTHMRPNGLPTK